MTFYYGSQAYFFTNITIITILMKLLIQLFYSALLILLLTVEAQAQIDNFVRSSANAYEQTDADISNYLITSSHVSARSGVAHYYIQQQHANIPIYNAVMGIHIDANDELLTMDNQFSLFSKNNRAMSLFSHRVVLPIQIFVCN